MDQIQPGPLHPPLRLLGPDGDVLRGLLVLEHGLGARSHVDDARKLRNNPGGTGRNSRVQAHVEVHIFDLRRRVLELGRLCGIEGEWG